MDQVIIKFSYIKRQTFLNWAVTLRFSEALSYILTGIIQFENSKYSVIESTRWTETLEIIVNRQIGVSGKVQARWGTRDITAKSGKDYTGENGSVVFEVGEVL